MVGYGAVLDRSRRPVWSTAYLDYEGLKSILNHLDDAVLDNSERLSHHHRNARRYNDTTTDVVVTIDDNVRLHSRAFTNKLHVEIEKVTLFCLSRLGDLAHSLGALRFDETNSSNNNDNNRRGAVFAPTLDRAENGLDDHEEEEWRVEQSQPQMGTERQLLIPRKTNTPPTYGNNDVTPPRRQRTASSLWKSNDIMFHSETLSIRRRSSDDDDNTMDKFGIYARIGVELLHLLKFATLNSVGIRKIVKKYEKTFLLHPLVHERGISDVILNNDNSSIHDRLLHLTSDASFNTVYASLIDALAESNDESILTNTNEGSSKHHRRGLSESMKRSREAVIQYLQQPRNEDDDTVHKSRSILQLECTVLSINAIQDFANAVSAPFQGYLSRKAMIVRGGNDNGGDLGSSNKRAIDVLVSFDPQFILEMNEVELSEWCTRAASKAGSKKGHTRETSTATINLDVLTTKDRSWGGVDNVTLVINLLSVVLYTVNYYIISPTANSYAILLGTEDAYGATLIGASSFAALFAAFLYSVWYTRFSFRSALIFSAICPLVGNLLYSFAISYNSMKLALFGRFLCGFGSAEVANRQLLSDCVSVQSMTRACAFFVTASAIGMSIGPLLAAIIDMTAGRDIDVDIAIHLPWTNTTITTTLIGSQPESGVILDHVTVPGFLMSFLWLLQLLSLIFVFNEPERINADMCDDSGSSSPCSTSSTKSDQTFVDSFRELYRVIFKNGAFPTTLYLFTFIEMTGEIMISSCSMVIHRYFRWHGSMAGLIIASLGALVLPGQVIVEKACHYYSERHILKWSMVCVICSIFSIFNYEGLLLDIAGIIVRGNTSKFALRLKKYVTSLSFHGEFPYDWNSGIYVYLSSLIMMFISTIVMEGVNTSLMSQTTPKNLNNCFINMGLLASVVGTFGRVFGDFMITACAFYGKSELHDFVSVTFAPLLPFILFGWYLMRRNYHFLQ